MRRIFDGKLTVAIMRRAKIEGISFFTHKIGEGLLNDDPLDGTCLAAARDAGIEILGGYYIPHEGLSPAAQADRCIQLADRDEPWWRTFPGWFWQVDAERWTSTDQVTKQEIQAFADRLATRTRKTVIVYASRGQYGNALKGLTYRLWNAAYPSSRQAPFKSLYPGDNGAGWVQYSGQTPVFWQYASSATIAGLTTCDANAFRGTEQDLYELIGGGPVAISDDDLIRIFNTVWYRDVDTGARTLSAGTALLTLYGQVPINVDALAAAIAAKLPPCQCECTGGGSVSPDEISEIATAVIEQMLMLKQNFERAA
jgi:GH25 family lysozyme M1 (1,4-beta-N-acetylmuramidase)